VAVACCFAGGCWPAGSTGRRLDVDRPGTIEPANAAEPSVVRLAAATPSYFLRGAEVETGSKRCRRGAVVSTSARPAPVAGFPGRGRAAASRAASRALTGNRPGDPIDEICIEYNCIGARRAPPPLPRSPAHALRLYCGARRRPGWRRCRRNPPEHAPGVAARSRALTASGRPPVRRGVDLSKVRAPAYLSCRGGHAARRSGGAEAVHARGKLVLDAAAAREASAMFQSWCATADGPSAASRRFCRSSTLHPGLIDSVRSGEIPAPAIRAADATIAASTTVAGQCRVHQTAWPRAGQEAQAGLSVPRARRRKHDARAATTGTTFSPATRAYKQLATDPAR